MFRRAFWFMSGVVAGISGFVWSRNRVVRARQSLTPSSLARLTVTGSTAVVRRVRRVVARGREVIRQGGATSAAASSGPPSRRHIATRPRRTHG